jgi:hypothetical protein
MKYSKDRPTELVGKKFIYSENEYRIIDYDDKSNKFLTKYLNGIQKGEIFEMSADHYTFGYFNDDTWKIIEEEPQINNNYDIF